jgi:type IV secretory pathway VirB2 component (pilin)
MKIMKLGILITAAMLFATWAPDALASTTGGGMPYESGLGKLRDSITGPTAFIISIIAIVIAGLGLIFGGDFNAFAKVMVYLVLVIGIVVAANNMFTYLFGFGAVMQPVQSLLGW